MVVYIITKLELGGAQKVCLALMDGLRENNELVGLISGSDGILTNLVQGKEHTYLLNSLKREIGITSLLGELKTFIDLVKTLRQLKKKHGDIIVHTHSTKAGLIGRWAAFFAGIKKRVHTIHGFGFNSQQPLVIRIFIYTLELITSLITTHFVCVSEKDQKTGTRLFPWFGKKSSIIRAAVDWKKFTTPNPAALAKKNQAKNFIIGTVSCFKPQKNLFDLLRAFNHAYLELQKTDPSLNLQLQIIGDGMQRQAIEAWIVKHNLSANILVLGWQKDVNIWMDNWDLFMMSSLWEGLPCAIVEARLKKLPVIAYDINGIPEVIKHGCNGFLEKPGAWENLANRIIQLASNPTLRSQLSMYQDNLDDFNNKTMVSKHLALYRHHKTSPTRLS